VATRGVSGPRPATPEAFERIAVGETEIVPVASPEHPLARMSPIPPGEARDYIQLVLSDRSLQTQGQDFGVVGLKTWRLADLSAKHALLLAGVGWGGMPPAMVDADIQAGRLAVLAIPEWGAVHYPFHVIHRIDTPPGPAGRWLIDHFVRQADPESG
jgi:DNA-binding transcriptional LysR family regulator